MTTTAVNTKKAQRRKLKFNSIAELRSELDILERAHRAGTLRATGNWTAGEIFDHIAKIWEYAMDGFPSGPMPPLFLRVVGTVLKGWATSGKTGPAGMKLPKEAAHMLPTQGCTFETGIARLRKVLDRVDAGQQCNQPSPLFGAMTHEGAVRMHFGHSQLHLGFLHATLPNVTR